MSPARLACVVALAAASACDEAPFEPIGTALLADLSDDLVPFETLDPGPAQEPSGEAVAAPHIFYLHYAGMGAPPDASLCPVEKAPPYDCTFGGDEGVEGCRKKVQVFLDRWYADFNLIFVLEKPTSGKYTSEVITNSGAYCGKGALIGGVSPGSCEMRESGTCFAFLCGGAAKTCAVIIAQEQAHLVGLLHTTSPKDLLYPTTCTTCDGFEDKDNELSGGSSCGRTTQNSYQLMKTRLGEWPGGEKPSPFGCVDVAPPILSVTEPADGAVLAAGFEVKATASDECGVREAVLEVEGATFKRDGGGPYVWELGPLTKDTALKITIQDMAGKTLSRAITVRPAGAPEEDAPETSADAGLPDAAASTDAGTADQGEGGGGGGGCDCATAPPSRGFGATMAALAAVVWLTRGRRARR